MSSSPAKHTLRHIETHWDILKRIALIVALQCKFTKALTFENSEFRIPPKYRMGVAWRAQFDPALGEAVVRQRAYNVSFLFSLFLSLSLALSLLQNWGHR
jgi:hypothetical protein